MPHLTSVSNDVRTSLLSAFPRLPSNVPLTDLALLKLKLLVECDMNTHNVDATFIDGVLVTPEEYPDDRIVSYVDGRNLEHYYNGFSHLVTIHEFRTSVLGSINWVEFADTIDLLYDHPIHDPNIAPDTDSDSDTDDDDADTIAIAAELAGPPSVSAPKRDIEKKCVACLSDFDEYFKCIKCVDGVVCGGCVVMMGEFNKVKCPVCRVEECFHNILNITPKMMFAGVFKDINNFDKIRSLYPVCKLDRGLFKELINELHFTPRFATTPTQTDRGLFVEDWGINIEDINLKDVVRFERINPTSPDNCYELPLIKVWVESGGENNDDNIDCYEIRCIRRNSHGHDHIMRYMKENLAHFTNECLYAARPSMLTPTEWKCLVDKMTEDPDEVSSAVLYNLCFRQRILERMDEDEKANCVMSMCGIPCDSQYGDVREFMVFTRKVPVGMNDVKAATTIQKNIRRKLHSLIGVMGREPEPEPPSEQEHHELCCANCGTSCLDHRSNRGRGSEHPCEDCGEDRCVLCPCDCWRPGVNRIGSGDLRPLTAEELEGLLSDSEILSD